jgi:hypothetical protein
VEAVQDDALVIALVGDGEDLSVGRRSWRSCGVPGFPVVMLTQLVNDEAVNAERPRPPLRLDAAIL